MQIDYNEGLKFFLVCRNRHVLGMIGDERSEGDEMDTNGAFAYVRRTRYDVRFIHNVRVAQIFFRSLMHAEIPLEPSS